MRRSRAALRVMWTSILGVENLLDFKQDDPILDADDPFGQYFDSALGWGPVFGRTAYAGVRYLINRLPEE